MVGIRELMLEDMESLVKLYESFWGERSDKQKMAKKFTDLKKNPNYIFLCAVKDNIVVGTIQGIICEELYGECEPFLVMDNFVVDASFRKQGIGKKLIKALEEIAKNKNCTQILFITETDRQDTIRFYESVGYKSDTHKGFKKSLR